MVMDIVGFAQASAACTAVGKTLSNIDAIFSGPNNKISVAAQAAMEACVGTNVQVWFDTRLTLMDDPPTCQGFIVTVPPTDRHMAPGAHRKLMGTEFVMYAIDVPTGCDTPLQTLCM